MARFSNKVVVVTGAAGGIGQAAATRFASEGAAVVAVDQNEGPMAESVAVELAPANIRVNAVCPGVIATRMMDSIEAKSVPDAPETYRNALNERVPQGRYGRADEVAAVAAFLTAWEASYVTGSIYTIDGGLQAS